MRGTWSDWAPIDLEKNFEVLDNIPEVAFEPTPDGFRPPALVDPLPFLKKGTWSGVDPEAVLKLPPPKPDPAPLDGKFGRRRSGSPVLTLRCLDFTVEAATTYRYRVRIVVVNPEKGPNVKRELFGPWSEPTREVAVP